MKDGSSIKENDLHAYVDKQLPKAKIEEVETWLNEHPDDAERVRQWKLLNQSIVDSFDKQKVTPIPATLDLKKLQQRLKVPMHN